PLMGRGLRSAEPGHLGFARASRHRRREDPDVLPASSGTLVGFDPASTAGAYRERTSNRPVPLHAMPALPGARSRGRVAGTAGPSPGASGEFSVTAMGTPGWIRTVTGFRLGQFAMYDPRPLELPPRYRVPRKGDECLDISIVTPVLNQADFIEQTVGSIL